MSKVQDSDMDISVPFTFEDPGEAALPNAVMKGRTIFDPYTNISTFTGMWGFSSADLENKNCSPCEYAGKFREPTDVEGTFTMKMENQEDEEAQVIDSRKTNNPVSEQPVQTKGAPVE